MSEQKAPAKKKAAPKRNVAPSRRKRVLIPADRVPRAWSDLFPEGLEDEEAVRRLMDLQMGYERREAEEGEGNTVEILNALLEGQRQTQQAVLGVIDLMGDMRHLIASGGSPAPSSVAAPLAPRRVQLQEPGQPAAPTPPTEQDIERLIQAGLQVPGASEKTVKGIVAVYVEELAKKRTEMGRGAEGEIIKRVQSDLGVVQPQRSIEQIWDDEEALFDE